jgi:hypothetical protein
MRRPARSAATALAAAMAVLAGCGTAAPAASGPAAEAPPGGAPFLATSLVTPAGTWAVAVMGGSVASHNNFWQLFERPAATADWKLVTPPGTADNGGLVLAPGAGPSLITGFRPSQYLTYTPLTATADGGRAWSSTGPLDGVLADIPDALAAEPGTGRLLAILAGGSVEMAAPPYTSWTTLASRSSLAANEAGRLCRLQTLTAAAYTPSGVPLLAGTCSRPGTAGIFAGTGTAWQPAGPAMPAALAAQTVRVLRLTATASKVVALLAVGSGHAASLLAAWSTDNGRHWALSAPLRLSGAVVTSAAFGPAGSAAVVTSGGHAEVISGNGSRWDALPMLPAGTATLAPGTGGEVDALAVHGKTLTVWQLLRGASTWTKTQVIGVPIEYGSSG